MSKIIYLDKDVLKDAGIPRNFWAAVPSERNSEFLLKQVATIRDNLPELLAAGMGILVYGPPLSGKTFWITYFLKCILTDSKRTVRYMSLHDIVDRYFSEGLSKEMIMYDLAEPDWLAVDNLCDGTNDGYRIVLNKVLRKRVDDGKPIMLGAVCENEADIGVEYNTQIMGTIKEHCHMLRLKNTAARFHDTRESLRRKLLPNVD